MKKRSIPKIWIVAMAGMFALMATLPAAENQSQAPVEVVIKTPNPGLSLKIQSAHTLGSKLILVCRVSQKGGIHAQIISKSKDRIMLPPKLASKQRVVYLLGKTWGWNEKGVSGITPEELKKHLVGSTTVYTAKPCKPAKPEKSAQGGYVGLTYEEAVILAKKNKLPYRVIQRDGQPLPVTLDHRPNRLNFTLKKNVVTRVTQG